MKEVTLNQAKELIMAMGQTQSILLLASPGVGKSDIVRELSRELEETQDYGPCQTLLGTQIAPEDVSGIPMIEDGRSVFCPPKILLPADSHLKPFVLFLDELPICSPDVQKAMYSLLLDRKLGEHDLPAGTIVVAAGNNVADRAMVRTMSSALVNRVIILHVKTDVKEWLAWGHRKNPLTQRQNIRDEILDFIAINPEQLQCKEMPQDSNAPFATPRSWASLSQALDNLERFRKNHPRAENDDQKLTFKEAIPVLAEGTLGAETADTLCDYLLYDAHSLKKTVYYMEHPEELPDLRNTATIAKRTMIFSRIRRALSNTNSAEFESIKDLEPQMILTFFKTLPKEYARMLILNLENTISNLAPEVLQWLSTSSDN